MFVDEVRGVMPSDSYLDQIKHNIIELAKQGKNEYIIGRPENIDLEEEIQWFKDNGFNVEERIQPSYEYYPKFIVSW